MVLETFTDVDAAVQKLESLESGFPDLIICDFDLGTMSGLDFLKRLRASRMGMIPVVIRSNSRSQQRVDAAYQHGANCYLQKGYDLEAIERNFRLRLEFWSNMCMPDMERAAGKSLKRTGARWVRVLAPGV